MPTTERLASAPIEQALTVDHGGVEDNAMNWYIQQSNDSQVVTVSKQERS